jgi:2'-5' RNA ligase
MEKVRAFIAIELPDPLKENLSLIIDSLRPSEHPYVKWVSPQGIHLTLKFLGNIAMDLVPRIEDAIAQAAHGTPTIKLQVSGLGCFPNLKQPRVIWVAVTGDVEPLITLQRGIDQALLPLGFATEKRPFSPHLTLGRLRERASPGERSNIGELITATECEAGSATVVNQISLMRSTLTPSGAIYNRLASIELKDS